MTHTKAHSPRRVLFFAEAVTLAHLARPLALSRAFQAPDFELEFACAPRYQSFVTELSKPPIAINSISSEQFLKKLEKGNPLYDAKTLRGYVKEDIAVIEQYKPDVIIGDFRISLSISARLTKTPYITISNVYWSPYAQLRYPIPDLPMVNILGVRLAQLLFDRVRPLVFGAHSRPLNKVRREHGLPSLGADLRRVYTDADITLYADISGMVDTPNLPPHHRFIGAIPWQPPLSPPTWWEIPKDDRPQIFVTLGSSGRATRLPTVLEALADLPIYVIAASAGRIMTGKVPENAQIAEYVPGLEAAARAAVVVCNGGSPTTQQALINGVPILGICSNLDQYLNMQAVQRQGAGLLLRGDDSPMEKIRASVKRLLSEQGFRQQAETMATRFAAYDAADRALAAVNDLSTGRCAAKGTTQKIKSP